MHSLEVSPSALAALSVVDWWAVTTADMERVAVQLLGSLPGGWVRRSDNYVRVGNVKYGSDARKLGDELPALSSEAKRILAAGNPEAALRAATFYHLRFENIHPLCEANGRIGRVILAGQLQQSLRLPLANTLNGLKDWEVDYARLFATNNSQLMFELMLDLLSRITGISLPPEAPTLSASIEPLHPQKNVPKNAPRLHPEKGLANPELVKKFAQQGRPPQRNNYSRKFG